jgi:hypothetical protein
MKLNISAIGMAGLLCLAAPLWPHHPGGGASASGLAAGVRRAHLLDAGSARLSLGLAYTAFTKFNDQQLKTAVEAQGGHASMTVRDFSLEQNLEISLGLNNWLQADIGLGTLKNENVREGHLHGDGSYGQHNFGNVSGLRNTSVLLSARVAEPGHGSLVLRLGGLVPTGEDGQLSDGISVSGTGNTTTGKATLRGKFSYLEPGEQPAFGGGAVLLGAAWSRPAGKRLDFDLSLDSVIYPVYRGYAPGDQLALGFSLNRVLGENEKWRISLQSRYTRQAGAYVEGEDEKAEATWLLGLGAALSASLSEKVDWNLGSMLPLADSFEHEGEAQGFQLTSSLSYGF